MSEMDKINIDNNGFNAGVDQNPNNMDGFNELNVNIDLNKDNNTQANNNIDNINNNVNANNVNGINKIIQQLKDDPKYLIYGAVGLIGAGWFYFNSAGSTNTNMQVNNDFTAVATTENSNFVNQAKQNQIVDNHTAFKNKLLENNLNDNLKNEFNYEDGVGRVKPGDNMALLKQNNNLQEVQNPSVPSPMIADINKQGNIIYRNDTNNNQNINNNQNQQNQLNNLNQSQKMVVLNNQELNNNNLNQQNLNHNNQVINNNLNQQNLNNQNVNSQKQLNNNLNQISSNNENNNQNLNNQNSNLITKQNIKKKDLKGDVSNQIFQNNIETIQKEGKNFYYETQNNNRNKKVAATNNKFKIKSIKQGQVWLDIGNNQLLIASEGEYLTNKIKVLKITEDCMFTNYGKLCM